MPIFKYLQFKLTEQFIAEMDEYVKKVNASGTKPIRYKRSFLFTEAIRYFIDKDIALKIK